MRATVAWNFALTFLASRSNFMFGLAALVFLGDFRRIHGLPLNWHKLSGEVATSCTLLGKRFDNSWVGTYSGGVLTKQGARAVKLEQ